MFIMECRQAFLEKLVAAFDKIQVPLVGFDGANFVPFLNYDDSGIYIIIPKLVHMFNLTLQQGINIFFYTLFFGAFFLGLLGFFLLYPSKIHCFITTILFAFFFRFSFYSGYDVYLAYLVAPLSIVPLFLYFHTKDYATRIFPLFMGFTGMIIGFTHYIRAYSSLGVVGFVGCMLLLSGRIPVRKKAMLLVPMIIGLMLSAGYFVSAVNQYKKYAKEHFAEFEDGQIQHVFWHPIYLGFSMIGYDNKEKIVWDDSFAYNKAKEMDPTIDMKQTQKYETIIKNEVFKLLKTQRTFVIWTLFAKLGVLFWYLLFYANVGLLALFFIRLSYQVLFSFVIALGLSSINSILVLPFISYSLSFIAFVFIFGLFCCNEFLRQYKCNAFLYRRKGINHNNTNIGMLS